MSCGSYIAPPLSDPEDPEAAAVAYDEATLWAGDLIVSQRPVRMNTILGSCVSVCLYDPNRRFGGMSHFLVPRGGTSALHGDWSTAELVKRMRRLGCSPDNLEAKIFGGGSPLRLANDVLAVGADNIAMARTVLAEQGVPLVAEKVGLNRGLRLFYENWTGVVWVRPHAQGNHSNGT